MCEIGVGEGNFAELMAYIGRFQRKKLLLVDNYCDYGKLSKKAEENIKSYVEKKCRAHCFTNLLLQSEEEFEIPSNLCFLHIDANDHDYTFSQLHERCDDFSPAVFACDDYPKAITRHSNLIELFIKNPSYFPLMFNTKKFWFTNDENIHRNVMNVTNDEFEGFSSACAKFPLRRFKFLGKDMWRLFNKESESYHLDLERFMRSFE